jgi:hypothetical protein
VIKDFSMLKAIANAGSVSGLPEEASCEQFPLPTGEPLEILSLPVAETGGEPSAPPGAAVAHLAAVAASWASAPALDTGGAPWPAPPAAVQVPLYGCHVIWTPARAAAIGPPDRLDDLRGALIEFAAREAELRDAERRTAVLLEGIEVDAAVAFAIDERLLARGDDLAARYREAVSIRRRLADLAPAVHAPPVHPPTLVAQLSERLRDRTRLAERHEHAVDRADLAERVTEVCGSRATELAIARRQLGLEWAIVVLLVVQTTLLLVELLGGQGTP